MPLTPFQGELARLLATNRSLDSHLAGGAALHLAPESRRYSNDLDYFHDSPERLATAFGKDEALLLESDYQVDVSLRLPSFVRATVSRDGGATKVEWAHDSAWRFMPAQVCDVVGYRLHPVDVATNKVLALAGRREPRDLVDVLDLHEDLLPLGALCWAAVGKDPGFSPLSLLELLRRRNTHRPEDYARLHLARAVDLVDMKRRWLQALDEAEAFVSTRAPEEAGCLYYSMGKAVFVQPSESEDVRLHYGRPGGVWPQVTSD